MPVMWLGEPLVKLGLKAKFLAMGVWPCDETYQIATATDLGTSLDHCLLIFPLCDGVPLLHNHIEVFHILPFRDNDTPMMNGMTHNGFFMTLWWQVPHKRCHMKFPLDE